VLIPDCGELHSQWFVNPKRVSSDSSVMSTFIGSFAEVTKGRGSRHDDKISWWIKALVMTRFWFMAAFRAIDGVSRFVYRSTRAIRLRHWCHDSEMGELPKSSNKK
jgi:hypothetical protein